MLTSSGLLRPPPLGGFGCWARYSVAKADVGSMRSLTRGGEGYGGAKGCKRENGGFDGGGDALLKGYLGTSVGIGGVRGPEASEPPLLSGSGSGGSLEIGDGEGGLGMGGMGSWGPSPGVPKALDWSLSRLAHNTLQVRPFLFSFLFFSFLLTL